MPVAGIDVVRVSLLLVNVGLVGYFKDGIKEHSAELVAPLPVGLFVADAHFTVAVFEALNLSVHLVFHGLEHLLLPPLSSLGVNFSALLVAGLSELSVVNDDLLALLSPPLLIDKLLLLLSLPTKALEDLVLTTLLLHFLVGLLLFDYQLSSPTLAVLSVGLTDDFLVLRTKTCCRQGQGHITRYLGGSCTDTLGKGILYGSYSFAGHGGKPLGFVGTAYRRRTVINALGNSPFGVALLHLGADSVGAHERSLELGDALVDLL